MNRSVKLQIRALAIYQIAGGILGVALIVWVMFSSEMVVTQAALRIGLFATGLFLFSILCGRMLLHKSRRGLKFSLANQVLQVLYFSIGTISYQYVAGLRIGVGIDMVAGWIFKFRLALSSFHFSFDTDLGQKHIGLNLIALFLIFWIERLLKQTKEVK